MWHLFQAQIKSAWMLLYLLTFWNSPHSCFQAPSDPPVRPGRRGHDKSPVVSSGTDVVVLLLCSSFKRWREKHWLMCGDTGCDTESTVLQTKRQTLRHITQTCVRPRFVFISMLTFMRRLRVVVSLHNPDKQHLAGPLYSPHSSKRRDFPSAASDTTLD